MKILFSRFFAVFCLTACLFVCAARAQQSARSALDVYAITNARIVTVSGAPVERGTIVIRNGLIFAVGANVQIPADARTIDGSGLTVYPGFIDAYSNIGIAAPQRQPQPGGFQALANAAPQAPQSGSNSTYPLGFQPEIAAADLIRANDASFETARNNGFAAALSVPRERLFVGQSALVNTAGDSAANLVLRAPVALHVNLVALQTGQFPTSIMGSFAAFRQIMLDAQRLQAQQAAYAKNPRGQRRPDNNRSLEALFPVLRGEIPVVFQADNERQIVRALDLTREFNIKGIIAGGGEAYKVADRLRQQNVPVLVSLNFPKRTAAASPEAEPETLETLRLRVETTKNAARLKQAGVRFAFQSGGATNLADFWTNANRAIENGLSKDDAVRAITLGAAEMFGMQNTLGSIEPGKIANLTVTRGDVFDKTRVFTHVFVDGRMFEIKQPAAPPTRPTTGAATTATTTTTTTTPAAVQNIAGTYTINIEIPGQPAQTTLVLTQQESRLSGSLQSQFGNFEINSGEVTSDGFTFRANVTIGQTFDVVFTGKVAGNQISGTATTPQGAIPFSGTKNP